MSVYTVKQVAMMSGVSVRALHHYDEIGLLKPACVGANGYRYYGRDELLRLQQILFHRELGFPLDDIRKVLDAADFDRIAALRAHRKRLVSEAARYRRLVRTLDATLAALEGDTDMNDKTLYQGFSPEKQQEYEAWLVARFGEGARAQIDQAREKMKSKGWGKADFERHLAEAETIRTALARVMTEGQPPDAAPVCELVGQLHAWVGRGWNSIPSREGYIRLAEIYREHPDFRATFEAHATGLTDYLAKAIGAYAERELT